MAEIAHALARYLGLGLAASLAKFNQRPATMF